MMFLELIKKKNNSLGLKKTVDAVNTKTYSGLWENRVRFDFYKDDQNIEQEDFSWMKRYLGIED
jgi:hypothetical protein